MTLALGLRLSHLFPVAFARYLVPLLPILYFWAALGLLTPLSESRPKRDRWIHWTVAVFLIASWLASGPYAAIAAAGFRTSFAGSKQPFTRRAEPRGIVRGEEFHRGLARAATDAIVTEFPMLDGSRLAFRNMVRTGPTAILGSDASHLVIHLSLFDEVLERFGSFPRHLEPRARNHEILARQLARDLRDLWGPPDREDEWIVVWDLNRLRSAAGPGT